MDDHPRDPLDRALPDDTPRVVIDSTDRDPVGKLLGALADNTTPALWIELCDVDLNLTGHRSIPIWSNRGLIASPDCARSPRRLGPRIYVEDKRENHPLFKVVGDNVWISGFRLQGPTDGIGTGDDKEQGIRIAPLASPDPIRNIEISNMEIFNWSGLGVQVLDNTEVDVRGRLFNTNPRAVRIRDSYFHHNRHGSGYGYGVAVGGGAYATIEHNVFDENRHAIAGGSVSKSGQDYSGYTASENLILAGGGKHCSENPVFALTGWHFNCWQTHQIDMHGNGNSWYSSANWQCGTAGETILIERNTVLYTAGLAIKIRGNPADKAVVAGNVFKATSRGDAIAQNGDCGWWGDNITKPLDVRDNTFGVDPMLQLGNGDFVGDGVQDEFMATGVTWWAKSPVTGQWRFLNTMPETLGEVELFDVDGDGICDVATRRSRPETPPKAFSKAGTGPWQQLLGGNL